MMMDVMCLLITFYIHGQWWYLDWKKQRFKGEEEEAYYNKRVYPVVDRSTYTYI